MDEEKTQEPTTQFLEKKYNLSKASEVQIATRRTEARTGEHIGEPNAHIQNFLDRFKGITNTDDLVERARIQKLHDRFSGEDLEFDLNERMNTLRERKVRVIKHALHESYVIKPDEIPESYWNTQRRILRENGQGGDLEQADFEETKRQQSEAIIADQQSSLDKWVDYLSSADALYPDSIKYFVLRSVLELGKYDKQEKKFPKRSSGMTQPFPELDREALAYVVDALVKKYSPEYFERSDRIDETQGQLAAFEDYEKKRAIIDAVSADATGKVITVEVAGKELHIKRAHIDIEQMRASLEAPSRTDRDKMKEEIVTLSNEQQEHLRKANLPDPFLGLPEDEDFGTLYAYAIKEVTPASKESLTNIQGKWVKYNRGSDHMPLVTSLQGHGTGWCTTGESTAQAQLKGGDFYVYYSNDSEGNPTIPRVAIRMEGSHIAEVRGIAQEQNLDAYIAPVVEEKMKEFGSEGEAYKKKISDMKQLKEIDHKIQADMPLERSELIFLYEIDTPIQGFGYERDPRIDELRRKRDEEADMSIIFDCDPSQIAYSSLQFKLNPDTRAYVCPLGPGDLQELVAAKIEHIYGSFPERKVTRRNIEIGGKTEDRLQLELLQAGVHVNYLAQKMMKQSDFATLLTAQDTVRLQIQDLSHLTGLFRNTKAPTIDQIYKAAEKYGLELCPAELGPQYILQHANKPIGNFMVGMKPIIGDSRGHSYIFNLSDTNGSRLLTAAECQPKTKWDSNTEFVFILRKS